MKKTIILALCMMLAGSNVYALSDWAVAETESANRHGLVTKNILSGDMSENITREEFCELAMNLYKNMGGKVEENPESPFDDTDNPAVISAFSLGIINGRDEKHFYPDAPVTRQEIAKIIMLTVNSATGKSVTENEVCEICGYEDFEEVQPWATDYMMDAVRHDIINGVSRTLLMPKGAATKEQALVIMNRAYNGFAESKTEYDVPDIYGLEHGSFTGDKLAFNWDETEGATVYEVIMRDAENVEVLTLETKVPYCTIDTSDLSYGSYSVVVGTKVSEYAWVYSEAESIRKTSEAYYDEYPTYQDKFDRVFPNGQAFSDYDSAKASMKMVTVPVWKLTASGEKVPSEMSLEVNVNLAEDVVKIFTEIYNDPERFPIKNVGGFSWRNTAMGGVSQHSYGTCIDINWEENYYCYASSGEAITGSFWRPYDNPYSIPSDGSVVRTFKKYGWVWGGDAWTTLRDYMHFSYLGK